MKSYFMDTERNNEITNDYTKVRKTIVSCETIEHIEVCVNMIDLFHKKHGDVVGTSTFTGQLEYMLYLQRRSIELF